MKLYIFSQCVGQGLTGIIVVSDTEENARKLMEANSDDYRSEWEVIRDEITNGLVILA